MTVRWSSSVLVPVVILVAWSIPSAFGCTRKCDRFEYCDENSNACRNCSALCEKDEYSCYHKCQTLRQNITTLQESVLTMKTIVLVFSVVAFVLICTALALLIKKYVHSIREFCRWRPQNKNTTTPPVAYTHENPNTKSPKTVPKNGANGPKQTSTSVSIYPETEVDHSVQTGTTSISHRYPAEDSTESYSYDNAACNVTPTSNNPMPKF
uniref:Protein grindelwald n=1 Tax=Anopheles stephensi TaxID=30069 RepID=A0A182YDT0_ANOST